MHGVDKAHFLENASAIEGAEVSLVSPFPLQSVSQVRGLCHRQETLWFLSAKKQEVRALRSRIRIGLITLPLDLLRTATGRKPPGEEREGGQDQMPDHCIPVNSSPQPSLQGGAYV